MYFPTGVKTCHRKWASDKVIEFEHKPPNQCISPIGRLTGFEPVLVFSVWHPTKELNRDRPVEGFYILRDIPTLESLDPAPFHKKDPEACVLNLRAVRDTICNHSVFAVMGSHAEKRAWWDNFFKYIPESADHFQYRAQLEALNVPLGEPLKRFLYNPDWTACLLQTPWQSLATGINEIGSNIHLPEVLALAGNCVESDFNPNPVHPKLYSARDEQLIASMTAYDAYFRSTFERNAETRTVSNDDFHHLLKRKVSYDCNFIAAGKGYHTY